MENTLKKKIVMLLAALMSGGFLFICFYLFINVLQIDVGNRNAPDRALYHKSVNGNHIYEESESRQQIHMHIGQELEIGTSKLIYRGLMDDDQIAIEVSIIDLDPEAYYLNYYSIPRAKTGFRVGDEHFKLISARHSKLRFYRILN